MNNVLHYKDYYGTVEYSEKDGILFGKVIGINSLISYEGKSIAELKNDFEGAVDDYLEMCREQGMKPEKTYKGSFNVRLTPELHRELARYAAIRGETLNSAVEEAVKMYIKV